MSNYDEYVKKYATKHEITEEEAEKHAMVKNVKDHYESKEKKDYIWWQ